MNGDYSEHFIQLARFRNPFFHLLEINLAKISEEIPLIISDSFKCLRQRHFRLDNGKIILQ